MKTNLFKLFASFAILLFVFQAEAQNRMIHGVVHTFDSIPLNGARILVKSSKLEIFTDTLGNFTLECAMTDKLKVTANGFYNQTVKVEPNTKIVAVNLRLKPGEKQRSYAVGYGHVTDINKLNALSNLNSNDLDFSQYSNMFELIRGRFAGVQIQGNEIIIRGINSINSSSAALIIVDGSPVESSMLNNIPPIHVKNINVIKDGSSAIYGSRGANGVVIIETKRGGDR